MMSFLLAALTAGLLTGCVERRMVITSDPPADLVLINNQPIGPAPADYSFVYYGTYKITLIKEGYQTLVFDQEVRTPWYERIPLDFVVENLWPRHIEDVRPFHYQLCPLEAVQIDPLLNQAEMLRGRGRALPQSEGVQPPPPRPVDQPETAPPPQPIPAQKMSWFKKRPAASNP
jgi:hypothetical protein